MTEEILEKKPFVNKFGDYNRSLTFKADEWKWVENFASEKRTPKTQVVRKAVRFYMLVEYYLHNRPYPDSAKQDNDIFIRLVEKIKNG